MTVAPGARLGPYEITAKLGEGGMGEVWRAHDSNLGRDVALKVLPAAFTEDAERLARFEREAKLLAQLNHPNIAHIYGLEASGGDRGVRALVMELVEGEDLAHRIARGALPVDEALGIAKQIAEALEAAHERGIVHRDLKPANVKVAHDALAGAGGTVKVLDFGLAKAMDAPGGTSSSADVARSPTLMNSPTLTQAHGTQLGVILGTAAYMSPEQAKGLAVDKRADIWAFGVVLYEMLAGQSLFVGDSVPDTLARVLQREIDFQALPPATPRAIRVLLRRCLERSPKRRLHDIADARIAIDDVHSGADRADESAAATNEPHGFRKAALLATGLSIAVGVLAWWMGSRTRVPAPAVGSPMQLAIELGASQDLVGEGSAVMAFSPDGRTLVFAAQENGHVGLFRRELGGRDTTPIPGTENGSAPFFSPDGRWLGFVADSQVMKVALDGGRPFPLMTTHGGAGGAWLRDGTMVVSPTYSDGLFRISADGGTPERLSTPDHANGELGHWWPDALPGERKVVFTAFHSPVDRSRIGVLDLTTHEVRWLVDGGFFGRYVPTGHLLYVKGKRLYALPFDAAKAVTTGAAVAVLDDVLGSQISGSAQLAVSANGTLAYCSESSGNPAKELVWIDRQGTVARVSPERRQYSSVSLSPDGREAALTIVGESRDLWTYSFERGTLSRLTSGEATEFAPIWFPGGRELLYIVDRPPFDFFRIATGAPDSGTPLWKDVPTNDLTEAAISPDGKTVAFVRTMEQSGYDLFLRPLDGHEPARAFRATRSDETSPSFSPDGRFLAYVANDTGRQEIYVEPTSGAGERTQVSADGGDSPVWARNGEIFFRHHDEMRAVATRIGTRFEFDPPRTLFTVPIVVSPTGGESTFDVSADGKRVLAITIPESARPRRIEVVTDWLADLARRVPGGKP
jgi:serine/threonine-protein kinase